MVPCWPVDRFAMPTKAPSIAWRSSESSNQQKSLLLKMRVDRESLGHAPLAHHNERYGVNQAEQSPAPIEQHVESRVVKCLIDPNHIDERREVRPKAPHGIETQAPGNKRIRFHQNIGCGQEQSLPGTQVSEGALRADMIVICLVEYGQKARGICEDCVHSNDPSR
jgi:hypothetical protein